MMNFLSTSRTTVSAFALIATLCFTTHAHTAPAVDSMSSIPPVDALGSEWIAIQSSHYPDRFIRHRYFLGELTTVNSELDQKDSAFRIVKGLAGRGSISFESMNFPGHYLRHQSFRIKLHRFEDSTLFREDASFKPRIGLATGLADTPIIEGSQSFESVNYPGYYIRFRSDNANEQSNKVFHLYLEKLVKSDAIEPRRPNDIEVRFRKDATFFTKNRWFTERPLR